MLSFKLSGAILEVTESLLGFGRTRVTYWYYNVETWMASVLGKKDEAPSQVMTAVQIDWVKRRYLPRAFFPEAPKPLNSAFDPKAKARYASVSASMEADGFYAAHSREECSAEWGRRYEERKRCELVAA